MLMTTLKSPNHGNRVMDIKVLDGWMDTLRMATIHKSSVSTWVLDGDHSQKFSEHLGPQVNRQSTNIADDKYMSASFQNTVHPT